MKDRIYLSAPHIGAGELEHIHKAFKTNWISTVGPQINEFEEKLANYTNNKFAVALSSGTAAIHLALRILGIKENDPVICQSFTFAGSAFPITYLGAKPIFIDSEPDTWNLDPNLLEEYLETIHKRLTTSTKLPKAIIPVHLYGMPAKMEEINFIASKYEIPVIEDAAEALGSLYQGKACGALGDVGILSFNGNKIITTSGGGALLSNNQEIIEKAKFLATQARDNASHYEHTETGYNYRMGNVNAAIGLGQMEVLDKRVSRKREIFELYKNSLAGFDYIQFQQEPEECNTNRWLTPIVAKSFEQREAIRLALEQENIESRPLWKPMHLQPVFSGSQYVGGNVSEDLFNRGICLPSGTAMNDDDLTRITNIIKTSLNSVRL